MDVSPQSQELINERIKRIDDYVEKELQSVEGDLSEVCLHLHRAGGKRLRPVTFLLVSELLGTNYQNVVPIGAGIECLHVSTLIQDDHYCMDNDQMRRGVETTHVKYGGGRAILASNILQSKSTEMCTRADVSCDVSKRAVRIMGHTMNELCHGQDLDLRFEKNPNVSVNEYFDMIDNKTARMYESAAKLGAVSANCDTETIGVAEDFGRNLGVAFQLVDDILDFSGSDTGKDKYSDLRNQKVTYITLHALNEGMPVFDESYGVAERIDMIEDAGSTDRAREEAQKYIIQAERNLDNLKSGKCIEKSVLTDLLEFAETRTR